MKPDMHPVYPPSRITCACGSVIETRSTRGSFNVEICSNCHPYFTGKYKLIDTAGRVERFRKKYGDRAAAGTEKKAVASAAAEKPKAPKAEKPAEKAAEKTAEKPAEKKGKKPEA